MNIIDTMISNVDHHNDCREPQYSASMFYDRSGDGIIAFGCDICCSYTNYQSSKAEIFDILNGTSLKKRIVCEDRTSKGKHSAYIQKEWHHEQP